MISVKNLSVTIADVEALKDISFDLKPGERLGVVGESGSGKTMLGLSLLGIAPESAEISGKLKINKKNMVHASEKAWMSLRLTEIAMVFQEPMTALNPIKRIGDTLCEPIRIHLNLSKAASKKRALSLLQEVGLPDPKVKINQFPHQLSGGQRQRVLIALALSCDPKVLIADEPTSALDAHVALKITDLLVSLSVKRKMALVFISHDLNAVARTTQHLAVMFKGEILEQGPTDRILRCPNHNYTKGLISARPNLNPNVRDQEGSLPKLATMADFFTEYKESHVTKSAFAETYKSDMKKNRLTFGSDLSKPLLDVCGLSRSYKLPRLNFFEKQKYSAAITGIGFRLFRGETLGIVGESGSGKSTIARLIMGFEKPDTGKILIRGNDINKITERKLRSLRSDFQIVFQDPFGSLDPRRKVGWSIAEPLRAQKEEANHKMLVAEVLERVGLEYSDAERYPHQFSGGQRQRIAIARSIVCRPSLLIADEAVSALDVSVQAQVLNLFMELQENLGLGMIFISHDLAVINSICDDVLVMKDGHMVETGSTNTIINSPKDSYTHELLLAARA